MNKELEEAIKKCEILIKVLRNCIPEEEPNNIDSAKAIETVLKELERLQEENNELEQRLEDIELQILNGAGF